MSDELEITKITASIHYSDGSYSEMGWTGKDAADIRLILMPSKTILVLPSVSYEKEGTSEVPDFLPTPPEGWRWVWDGKDKTYRLQFFIHGEWFNIDNLDVANAMNQRHMAMRLPQMARQYGFEWVTDDAPAESDDIDLANQPATCGSPDCDCHSINDDIEDTNDTVAASERIYFTEGSGVVEREPDFVDPDTQQPAKGPFEYDADGNYTGPSENAAVRYTFPEGHDFPAPASDEEE